MNKTSQPSPLPWRIQETRRQHRTGGGVNSYVRAADGVYVTSGPVQNEANAEFIVRACNSHHELLAALKAILADVTDSDIPKFGMVDWAVIANAKTVIANAKGQPVEAGKR